MKTKFLNLFSIFVFFLLISSGKVAAQDIKKDQFETSIGTLDIYHIGHASLYFEIDDKVIHVDPFGRMGDYSSLPKADLILITHAHGDHLDPETIKLISKDNTKIILNQASFDSFEKGEVLANGDNTEFSGFPIKAVPAYNIEHTRNNGEPFHPKGRGNGYVMDFGDTRVYIAGDTENIPEMNNLKKVDIAFLPMNLPYTMNAEMCKKAALMVQPTVLFPYHYKMGEGEPEKFAEMMKDVSEIEVRFRQ